MFSHAETFINILTESLSILPNRKIPLDITGCERTHKRTQESSVELWKVVADCGELDRQFAEIEEAVTKKSLTESLQREKILQGRIEEMEMKLIQIETLLIANPKESALISAIGDRRATFKRTKQD